ncbi:hypothetical protein NL676_004256 [Syzygium grande]|nr:hypothetical protein NL676_004256 [Syzygium grande]
MASPQSAPKSRKQRDRDRDRGRDIFKYKVALVGQELAKGASGTRKVFWVDESTIVVHSILLYVQPPSEANPKNATTTINDYLFDRHPTGGGGPSSSSSDLEKEEVKKGIFASSSLIPPNRLKMLQQNGEHMNRFAALSSVPLPRQLIQTDPACWALGPRPNCPRLLARLALWYPVAPDI